MALAIIHPLPYRYAALDAYACLLLYARITELSDPIFRGSDDLSLGDNVRLYTRGGNDCVGEGCIVEYGEETWGTTGFFLVPRRTTRGHARRWVVRLDKVHVARAKALYPDADQPRGASATAQIGDRTGSVVLWDANRLRKTSMTAAATTSTERTGGSAVPGDGGAPSVTPTVTAGAASSPDGDRSTGPGVPRYLGVVDAGGTVTGGGGEAFTTPSEPFFAGQLDGIEALSSEYVAYSGSAEEGGDVGQGGKEGDTSGEEEIVDVTGDLPNAELEDFQFLKVRIITINCQTQNVFFFNSKKYTCLTR